MGGPVVVGALELQHDIAGTIECQSFVGNGGAGDVAAQVFQLLALMGSAAHLGMEAEALRVGAAHGVNGGSVGRVCKLSTFWPARNAVGAGCRPQGPEREIRIGVGEIGHALLFDEEALARQ